MESQTFAFTCRTFKTSKSTRSCSSRSKSRRSRLSHLSGGCRSCWSRLSRGTKYGSATLWLATRSKGRGLGCLWLLTAEDITPCASCKSSARVNSETIRNSISSKLPVRPKNGPILKFCTNYMYAYTLVTVHNVYWKTRIFFHLFGLSVIFNWKPGH